ncbi:MAG: tetratricopeptide repeat protein [Planctomycetaceae bacterium]
MREQHSFLRGPCRCAGLVSVVLCGLACSGCGGSSKPSSEKPPASATTADEVKSLLEKATSALQQRQWQAALQSLTEAIKHDPECSEAYFQRGSLLADAGQIGAALADFTKAIELSPKDAKLRHSRAFLLMTQKQIDAAIADFTAAIELNPKYTQALNNRGLAWLAKDDRSRAHADFEQALQIEPKYVDAIINRGFTAYQSKQHKQAIADYDQALKLSPDNVSAFNNRGLAYLELKDFERAAADFTQAIARERYNPKFYLQRRACYLQLDRAEDAQADAAKVAWLGKLNFLNRTVTQEPKAAGNYVELAQHLIAGGESKVGLASYETAMQVQPGYGRSYSSRADFWLSQGEFDKAIADCDRALKIEPHFEAYSIRGDAYFQKQDYDRAIADYIKAKRLDQQVAKAYLQRAKKHAAAGRAAEAARDREQAYDIEPSLEP